MTKIAHLFDEQVAQGKIQRDYLRGCTKTELDAVEACCSHALPMEYREFLLIAGKEAGTLFCGADIFYPDMLTLRTAAEELLREDGKPNLLPRDAFVFLMHQGYQFSYFVPGTDDPLVYHFVEGDAEPKNMGTFSEFVGAEVKGHLRNWKDLNSFETSNHISKLDNGRHS